MTSVTGGDEQTFSRRGRASRLYQEPSTGIGAAFQNWMNNATQGMAQAVGLGEQQPNLDPRITGNAYPEAGNVTTGGGGRGSGTGQGRVTGGGGGGGGNVPITGTNATPGGSGGLGQSANQVRNALFDRGRLLQGTVALPALGIATNELIQGRPLGAAAGAVGGLAAGGATAAITSGLRSSKNPLLKAAGYVVPALASAAGTGLGDMAESAKAEGKLPGGIGKGQAITGREGSLAEQIGMTDKLAEAYSKMDARTAQLYIQTQKQLGRDAAELDLEIWKRQQPGIEQAKRNDLVRQQALIATMGQNYAMLGTVATAGKLALGSQEEAGLNLRTALQANPYQHGVLAAPNITF